MEADLARGGGLSDFVSFGLISRNMSAPVRVRFAPSPTGYLHIGGLRSALYNWLFARRHGGVFALRIEDTDRSRYVEGAVEGLQNALARCGLTPDEGPYIQSERRERHLAYAYELIEKGHAYYCFCTKERLEEVAGYSAWC
jgi:glutamyl/glutaminyl-tRNA synthetase